MPSIAEKRRTFQALHAEGCFVLPNPFDAGSARYLQHLGFKALATTSAGAAFALGLPDNAVGRDRMLAHIAALVAASDLPVNADFENGFADDPEGVAANVRLCAATGVAGLSIEDATGRPEQPLYELAHAVGRIRAARAAIDDAGGDVMLVARAECFLVGHPDPLRESINRLAAYAEAGADVLYAPGPRTVEAIAAIVKAVAPKPVNVLVGGDYGLAVRDIAALGVRRISVGGALARSAWAGFMKAAEELAREGSFAGFAGAAPHAVLNRFFVDDMKGRSDL
jgi:2-methylisocitrate lyase-like PEP mutase family enzyme